jgi:hypothetical protein
MSRLLPIGAIAFAIFYLATSPADAADAVHSAIGWLGAVGHGLSNFVTDVA